MPAAASSHAVPFAPPRGDGWRGDRMPAAASTPVACQTESEGCRAGWPAGATQGRAPAGRQAPRKEGRWTAEQARSRTPRDRITRSGARRRRNRPYAARHGDGRSLAPYQPGARLGTPAAGGMACGLGAGNLREAASQSPRIGVENFPLITPPPTFAKGYNHSAARKIHEQCSQSGHRIDVSVELPNI